jgi:hypothetical protein
MDGWVDGWMGGWVDGWMGGWVDGWMGGWVYEARVKIKNLYYYSFVCVGFLFYFMMK